MRLFPKKSETPPGVQPEYLDLDALVEDLNHLLVGKRGRLVREPAEKGGRKLAIVVSGGGASGAYTAGALESLLPRLEKEGLSPDLFVGASAGALNVFGAMEEALEQENEQLRSDPAMRQPCTTYIAAIWSYLDRGHGMARWIAGRRHWIADIASRRPRTWRVWAALGGLAAFLLVFNPVLLISASALLGLENRHVFTGAHILELAAVAAMSFVLLMLPAYIASRLFRNGLVRDVPMLRLLANTGPGGDLSKPWFWPREETLDRARVLSRQLVQGWYEAGEKVPELIIPATDITASREALFTLVRPDTYKRLLDAGRMAIQLEAPDSGGGEYLADRRGLSTLAHNFINCVVSSTAVPGAFPPQTMPIYGRAERKEARHLFVDGGLLNNSPLHVAIDAGATHIISLEVEPLRYAEPLDIEATVDTPNLIAVSASTFSTVVDMSTSQDVRRTCAWNRYLVSHPEALAGRSGESTQAGPGPQSRRLVQLYRVAPKKREINSVEYAGRWDGRRCRTTLRDWLERGKVDVRGKGIWRATLQAAPVPDGEA